MAEGATRRRDARRLRARAGAARARRRLQLARGRQRDAARARLPRRAPRPRPRHLLRRRADARLARARARRRPRPAAARRADQPPRHRVARVAREVPAVARRRRRARRPRPLVPRGGRHRRARARGRPREVLQGHLARVAQGEGGARAGARPRDREAGGARSRRSSASSTRFRAGTRARQAQSRVKQLDKIERLGRDPRDGKALGFAFKPPERAGPRRSSSSRTARCGSASATLLDDAELWLERGEHVSLVGAERLGQDDADRALAGERELDGGKLRRGPQRQARATLPARRGARARPAPCSRRASARPGSSRTRRARCSGRFLFSGEEAEKPLDGLSGGERRRLSLAILVHSGANVLILDEPTNHLDLESREALEAALQAFPGALLLVSHDRALLDAVGTRTVASRTARCTPTSAAGRSTCACARSAPRPSREAEGAREGKPKAKAAAAAAAPRPRPKNRQRQARRLEAEIERAEAELAAIEEELADPQAWNDPRTAEKSTQRHAEAKRASRRSTRSSRPSRLVSRFTTSSQPFTGGNRAAARREPVDGDRRSEVIRAGDLEVRPDDHLALARGRALSLSVRELDAAGRAGAAAGPHRPARGALRDGVGRTAARRRPLRRRLRPQAAVEAGPRDAGVPVHPHALRLRLPLRRRSRFTPFHSDGHTRNRMDFDEERTDCC